MFFTYILWSETLKKFYVRSQDLGARLAYHNSGNVRFTPTGIPWVLLHQETYETRYAASRRERQIKAWKSAVMIRNLIGSDQPE